MDNSPEQTVRKFLAAAKAPKDVVEAFDDILGRTLPELPFGAVLDHIESLNLKGGRIFDMFRCRISGPEEGQTEGIGATIREALDRAILKSVGRSAPKRKRTGRRNS